MLYLLSGVDESVHYYITASVKRLTTNVTPVRYQTRVQAAVTTSQITEQTERIPTAVKALW